MSKEHKGCVGFLDHTNVVFHPQILADNHISFRKYCQTDVTTLTIPGGCYYAAMFSGLTVLDWYLFTLPDVVYERRRDMLVSGPCYGCLCQDEPEVCCTLDDVPPVLLLPGAAGPKFCADMYPPDYERLFKIFRANDFVVRLRFLQNFDGSYGLVGYRFCRSMGGTATGCFLLKPSLEGLSLGVYATTSPPHPGIPFEQCSIDARVADNLIHRPTECSKNVLTVKLKKHKSGRSKHSKVALTQRSTEAGEDVWVVPLKELESGRSEHSEVDSGVSSTRCPDSSRGGSPRSRPEKRCVDEGMHRGSGSKRKNSSSKSVSVVPLPPEHPIVVSRHLPIPRKPILPVREYKSSSCAGRTDDSQPHSLFYHGRCRWPGCTYVIAEGFGVKVKGVIVYVVESSSVGPGVEGSWIGGAACTHVFTHICFSCGASLGNKGFVRAGHRCQVCERLTGRREPPSSSYFLSQLV